jgi:hypothetical protein
MRFELRISGIESENKEVERHSYQVLLLLSSPCSFFSPSSAVMNVVLIQLQTVHWIT